MTRNMEDVPAFPNQSEDGLTRLVGFSDIDDEWHGYEKGQKCYTEAHTSEHHAWAEPGRAGVPLQAVGPIVEIVNQGKHTWVVAKFESEMVSSVPVEEELSAVDQYRELVDDIVEAANYAEDAAAFVKWVKEHVSERAESLRQIQD